MADDRLEVAVDTVARRIIRDLVEDGMEGDLWGDYPDIGGADWEQVTERMQNLLDQHVGKDDPESFDAAYGYLDARADAE